MGDVDIDYFIQQQKAKLANERQNLNNVKRDREEYSQWRKQNANAGPTMKLELSRDPKDGPFSYERGLEREAYKHEWRKLASQRKLEPGGQRKKWDAPVQLSPRGYLDTDHIVAKIQRDEPLDEYKAKWKEEHRKNQVPKLQAGKMAQREQLNTDSIVEKIAGEKVEEDFTPRRRNLQNLNTGLFSDDDKNNYKMQWKEENKARNISETEKNINQTIAEAQKDASEYRKKWEARGNQGHPNLQQQTDDFKANSLPVNESDNAKWQKIKERNDEYNQFLAQKNERDRNRFADKKAPERDDKYANSIPGLSRSSAQKRRMEEERNKEYNDMLLRQNQRTVKQGWSTPDYQDLLEKNRAREQNFRRANDIAYETDPQTRYNYHDVVSDDRSAPKLPAGRRKLDKGGEYYYASLPLGRDSGSAQRRQKEEYRNDLQRQMAQSNQARQIERQEGLLVNNSGLANPQTTRTPRQRNPGVMNYNAVLARAGIEDELSPRANAILGRRQDTADRRRYPGLTGGLGDRKDKKLNGDLDNSILDLGLFSNPNPRATSLQPPPELMYQPSTFITANAVPALNNSVDEAYNYFATQNPLDPDFKADGGQAFAPGTEVVRGGPSSVPALNLSDVNGDGQRVRFNEQRGKQSAAQGMMFGTDDDRKKEQRQTANDYRAELERQIAEKNLKKRLAKEEQERYDLKMEEEARNYDPFGKGGGGAPMRDVEGNVVSDLRQMRNDNNVAQTRRSLKNEFSPRVGFALDTAAAGNTSRAANSYRDDLIGPPPTQTTADGDPSFARGGHGIFGMPKTDVEKMQADKYKVDLKKQIEEKKAEEYRKKQLERLEEEREQRLLEEQRAKMQAEYDEEQRRILEKQEEARRKNEEMMRAAEEKKREIERQRREEDEKRQEELRREKEEELRERQRAASPPIPAARTRTVEADMVPQDTAPRAQSADVLNQLTRLRAELRKESDRVQTMLHDQEDDVEIYDPRQLHRPPPAPIVSGARPEVDVFETAMNRNAVAVRRTPADRVNSTVMNDFSDLKHKNDSDSRKHFRNLYPAEPTTSDALEAQQAALLRQQEDRLRNLKERRALEDTSALRIGRDIHSSSSQLHSNSQFVDMNGISQFPDDFEDMPKRNDSARYRRRNRIPSSPQIERILTPDINSRSTFGSQTSLNVDKLARKNEDRLRKLRDMQGDDLSLYDPEDVLNRFMSKQDHNRMELDDLEIESRLGDTSPAFSTPVPQYVA